jgi:hypothetical protein
VVRADVGGFADPLRLFGLYVDRAVDLVEQRGDAIDREAHHGTPDMVGVVVGRQHTGDGHVVRSGNVDELTGGVRRVDENTLTGRSVADRVDEVDHLLGQLVALRKVTAGQELTEVETIVFRCAVHLAQRTLNGYVDQ